MQWKLGGGLRSLKEAAHSGQKAPAESIDCALHYAKTGLCHCRPLPDARQLQLRCCAGREAACRCPQRGEVHSQRHRHHEVERHQHLLRAPGKGGHWPGTRQAVQPQMRWHPTWVLRQHPWTKRRVQAKSRKTGTVRKQMNQHRTSGCKNTDLVKCNDEQASSEPWVACDATRSPSPTYMWCKLVVAILRQVHKACFFGVYCYVYELLVLASSIGSRIGPHSAVAQQSGCSELATDYTPTCR
jgi:hypothetical protein